MAPKMRIGTFAAGASSFNTGLGATPSAVVLMCGGVAAGAITDDLRSSYGASDGGGQWVSSWSIPLDSDSIVAEDNQFVDLDTAAIVKIFDDAGATVFAASVDGFNADGTIDLSWSGSPTGTIGFVAWSGIEAAIGTESLGHSGQIGSPQTLTTGFETKALFMATALGHIEGGQTVGWWAAGFPGGSLGTVSKAQVVSYIEIEEDDNPIKLNGGDGRLVSFGAEAAITSHNTGWDVDIGSVTSTTIQVERTSNSSSVPSAASAVGWLALGGPDIEADAGVVPFDAIPLGQIVLLTNSTNTGTEDDISMSWGAWDALDHQWALVTYARGDENSPHESHMRRAFYDDKVGVGLTDEGTAVGADIEVDATPNQFGEPDVTLTGFNGEYDGYGRISFLVAEPIVEEFGSVSFDGLVYPQRGDVRVVPGASS
jgi:hypothetical protein